MSRKDQGKSRRIPSGVLGFDELVNGGLLPARLYIISGPPGSGKTTFCTQFITQGVKEGDACLYVTMHETKSELIEDMKGYDFGFNRAAKSDQIQFINLVTEGGKQTMAKYGKKSGLTNRLVSYIKENDIQRAVIDSTMLLRHFMDSADEEITSFLSALKKTNTTTLLISEMTDPTSYSDEHYLAHGVIFFHNFLEGGNMTRGLQVIKMRGTSIDCNIRNLSFTDKGLQVHSDQQLNK